MEALRGTDYQVIVSMGETAGGFGDLPGNIQVYRAVDQMAVLRIADAFVTHCGMNSASEGLYFKVPLILAPQTPEQMAVAKRVEELGAGVMLPASGGSAEEIRNAVGKVLNDGAYKASAAKISEGFRRCGGVKEARAFLEKLV